MFLVIIIAALAATGIVKTFIELRRDGYRRVPDDPERLGQLSTRS